MGNGFVRVADTQGLEELLEWSKDRPVVVFKHSNACPISSTAYAEMEQVKDVRLVVVQTAREVSRELESLTGVPHESPQVIVLRDGKAVWNASHYNVKAGAVEKAVEANS
jgi:bacillithiol system protein YtxJ